MVAHQGGSNHPKGSSSSNPSMFRWCVSTRCKRYKDESKYDSPQVSTIFFGGVTEKKQVLANIFEKKPNTWNLSKVHQIPKIICQVRESSLSLGRSLCFGALEPGESHPPIRINTPFHFLRDPNGHPNHPKPTNDSSLCMNHPGIYQQQKHKKKHITAKACLSWAAITFLSASCSNSRAPICRLDGLMVWWLDHVKPEWTPGPCTQPIDFFVKSRSPGVSHESYTASYINIQESTG